MQLRLKSNILKLALFATGLSGIVAEYILATLASHFLSDSVFQWTMIVSIMLFSMGLGSRISKHLEQNLLQKFIYIEFALSVLTAFSSLFAYTATAYTVYVGFIIYGLCIAIGILIGMEIPLVIRLNDAFEELKINVSSILEKDYFGSLAGGLFFAFVGLPYLGLTYTPFILGFINFSVAVVLLLMLISTLDRKFKLRLSSLTLVVGFVLVAGIVFAKPVIIYGEQKRYKDKIIFSEQSRYQKIVMTEWRGNHWLYINGNQQLSTLDEALYHEPLVHPAMSIVKHPQNVLVLGGGDGCAAREILKYPSVTSIDLVDLDPVMTQLGKSHPVLLELNQGSLNQEKVSIQNMDAYKYLNNDQKYYDVIIIDLPDPKSVELGRLYSKEFYQMAYRRLRPHGVIITQAGSPYYATRAFLCIKETMQAAGFNTCMMHNQILTLGEWGWIIGVKNNSMNLKKELQGLTFNQIDTQWLNQEAMQMMTSFGKQIYTFPVDSVEINQIHNPVLYRYYLKGNWDIY